MTYYPQYPQYNYVPQQQVMQQPTVQQPVNENGILWVQGEAGAKSWAVAPGKSVMLMDSEANTFYIKSSDASGMPMPLRIFDYTERTVQQMSNHPQVMQQPEIDTSKFVTREEFDKKLTELLNREKSIMHDIEEVK
jgi:hypothetical protein